MIGWGLRERRWSKAANEEVEPAKTLWDVAQLLIVPAMLAAIAIGFNASQSSREERREDARIAADRVRAENVRHEDTLQRYFDRISDLLLTHGLQRSQKGAVVRQVARNVTLATLRGLDGPRKAQVVAFLSDAGLLRAGRSGQVDASLVSLRGADLSGADFSDVNQLQDTSLDFTNLRGARFDAVLLDGVGFELADLRDAQFYSARISSSSFDAADLRRARFDDARISADRKHEMLLTATCLSGASFNNAVIFGADLGMAEGRGVDFRGARLRFVSLDDMLVTDVLGRAPDWGVHRRDSEARLHPCSLFALES